MVFFFTDIFHVNMVLNGTSGFRVVYHHLLHIYRSWFKSFLQELLFLLKNKNHKNSISSGFQTPSPKQLLVPQLLVLSWNISQLKSAPYMFPFLFPPFSGCTCNIVYQAGEDGFFPLCCGTYQLLCYSSQEGKVGVPQKQTCQL